MALSFALSIHNFINKVGADAGFASIIGLAVLVLVYFAQARETATLREHASEAADRIRQLEGQLAQLARSQQGAAQPPRPAGSRFSSRGAPARGAAPTAMGAAPSAAPELVGAGAGMPAAPAGVGAPALSTATKLIPAPLPEAPASEDAPAEGVQSAGAGQSAAPSSRPGAPAPATAAAMGNGNRATTKPPGGGSGIPPRVELRSAAPGSGRRRPPSSPSGSVLADEPASPGRRIVLAIAGLGAIVLIAVGLVSLTSGGSAPKPAPAAQNSNAPSATAARHPRRRKLRKVLPSNVTVAVLNGTATANLAHNTATKLSGIGYKLGQIRTATNQTHSTTDIEYLSPADREDALAVAKSLNLPNTDVRALVANDRAVACPTAGFCAATVIVTVGDDLAGGGTGTTAGTGTTGAAGGGTSGATGTPGLLGAPGTTGAGGGTTTTTG